MICRAMAAIWRRDLGLLLEKYQGGALTEPEDKTVM